MWLEIFEQWTVLLLQIRGFYNIFRGIARWRKYILDPISNPVKIFNESLLKMVSIDKDSSPDFASNVKWI